MLLGVQCTVILAVPPSALFLARMVHESECLLALHIPSSIIDILTGLCTREPIH